MVRLAVLIARHGLEDVRVRVGRFLGLVDLCLQTCDLAFQRGDLVAELVLAVL